MLLVQVWFAPLLAPISASLFLFYQSLTKLSNLTKCFKILPKIYSLCDVCLFSSSFLNVYFEWPLVAISNLYFSAKSFFPKAVFREKLFFFKSVPIYSILVQPIPAHSSLFQLIPAYVSLFQPIQAYSSQFQPIPAYSSLFQPIPAYLSLFKPIPAYFRHHFILSVQRKCPGKTTELE